MTKFIVYRKPWPSELPELTWPSQLPDVVVHNTVSERDESEYYVAAKVGNHLAAHKLVLDLMGEVTDEMSTLRLIISDKKPILVPVAAIEQNGYNAIPSAMVYYIKQWLNLPSDEGELRQINKVAHTRARSWQRIVTPPVFSGAVEPGRDYVLVDDHVGLGGTLANLRGYIEEHGGNVIAMTTMTESHEGAKISLPADTLAMIQSKYGNELETFWQEHFGYGIECLTASEGRVLLREKSFDAIRRFLLKAADEANDGGAQAIGTLS